MKNLIQSLLFACLLLTTPVLRAQVPVHNSFPTAAATIFLDFDGHYLVNTGWNWSGPLTLNPPNLTPAQMSEIFYRVAEDYRPFNINITTDSAKYWQAPITQRMRIILTSSHSWYGNAGGVAYVNSFSWGDNTPAFVFTALLGSPKWIAEATSHEAGHTLGLKHQSAYDQYCTKTAEYHPGIGSGEIAWAPIMGVGYYRNFTLWNNGSDPFGCNSMQDDLGIITGSTNNFGYRADDHSNNSGGSATATSFNNLQFQVNGIIEQITDKDHFKFTLPSNGNFHLDALPYNIGAGNIGSNLDMQISLLSSPSNVIGVYNPQNTLGAVIDTMLNAGTYFIRVEGKGNMYAPEYASLGSYNLSASFVPFGVLPLRQLELSGKRNETQHMLNWIIDADEQVIEQVLEVSDNGAEFSVLQNMATSARSFTYSPKKNGQLHYRVQVKFDNGTQYYSNTIVLKHEGEARPQLMGNINASKLTVQSPSRYQYIIADYSGRVVAKGQLIAGINQIEIHGFSAGIYLVQFINGNQHYTEKFMKP